MHATITVRLRVLAAAVVAVTALAGCGGGNSVASHLENDPPQGTGSSQDVVVDENGDSFSNGVLVAMNADNGTHQDVDYEQSDGG